MATTIEERPERPPPQESQQPQSLLSKKSLALSLSAPRAPPHSSAHRHVLLGKDPSKADWIRHYRVKELESDSSDNNNHITGATSQSAENSFDAAHSFYPHDTLRQRLLERFLQSRRHADVPSTATPHPHLPTGPELGDQITRTLGLWLPHAWTHQLRDQGGFRTISDGLMTAMVPLFGLLDPGSAQAFARLTRQCKTFCYGSDMPKQQYVDVFLPKSSSSTSSSDQGPCRLVFFVHGGAW